MMNRKFTVGLIAAAVVAVGGCGGPEQPGDVLLNVIRAVQVGEADAEFLSKTCVPETALAWTVNIDELRKELSGATFSIVSTKIDGERAKIVVSIKGGRSPKENEVFWAMKKKGKWLIEAR